MQDFGPIIEPESIAYSYDTLGWKLLFGLGIFVLLIFLTVWFYRYFKNAYRREALKAIHGMEDIGQINQLLKAVALKSFERREVASLYDDKWVAFLFSKLKKTAYEEKEITLALKAAYVSPNEDQCSLYKSFAIDWIRRYHV